MQVYRGENMQDSGRIMKKLPPEQQTSCKNIFFSEELERTSS